MYWSMYRHRFPDNVSIEMAKAKEGDIAATARCLTAIAGLAEVNVLKVALRDLLTSQVTGGSPMGKSELDGVLAGLAQYTISSSITHPSYHKSSVRRCIHGEAQGPSLPRVLPRAQRKMPKGAHLPSRIQRVGRRETHACRWQGLNCW